MITVSQTLNIQAPIYEKCLQLYRDLDYEFTDKSTGASIDWLEVQGEDTKVNQVT